MFACFIRPAFERRGIGRALMQATENGLRAAGVERVWLSTGGFDEPNVRALGFYRHLGWSTTDAWRMDRSSSGSS